MGDFLAHFFCLHNPNRLLDGFFQKIGRSLNNELLDGTWMAGVTNDSHRNRIYPDYVLGIPYARQEAQTVADNRTSSQSIHWPDPTTGFGLLVGLMKGIE